MFFNTQKYKDLKEKNLYLWNFLVGHFHEDVEGIQGGLIEYLKLSNSENTNKVIVSIDDFLKDEDSTIEEKRSFLDSVLRINILPLENSLEALKYIRLGLSKASK